MLHYSEEHLVQKVQKVQRATGSDRMASCGIATMLYLVLHRLLTLGSQHLRRLWPDVRFVCFKISVPWIPVAYSPNNAIGSTGTYCVCICSESCTRRGRERERETQMTALLHTEKVPRPVWTRHKFVIAYCSINTVDRRSPAS